MNTNPVFVYSERPAFTLADDGDAVIEASRLARELMANIHRKIAAQQCGEAFEGLDLTTNSPIA